MNIVAHLADELVGPAWETAIAASEVAPHHDDRPETLECVTQQSYQAGLASGHADFANSLAGTPHAMDHHFDPIAACAVESAYVNHDVHANTQMPIPSQIEHPWLASLEVLAKEFMPHETNINEVALSDGRFAMNDGISHGYHEAQLHDFNGKMEEHFSIPWGHSEIVEPTPSIFHFDAPSEASPPQDAVPWSHLEMIEPAHSNFHVDTPVEASSHQIFDGKMEEHFAISWGHPEIAEPTPSIFHFDALPEAPSSPTHSATDHSAAGSNPSADHGDASSSSTASSTHGDTSGSTTTSSFASSSEGSSTSSSAASSGSSSDGGGGI